jgi:predicted anti-sigma-YlaC factor YlaD
MMTRSCEHYAIAAMARSEGFERDIPDEELDRHLAACGTCRADMTELSSLNARFASVQRKAGPGEVWPHVAERISRPRNLLGYLVLGALLSAGKLFEMVTGNGAPLAVEFLMALLAAVVLYFSREQLFRIVSDAGVEGDTQ